MPLTQFEPQNHKKSLSPADQLIVALDVPNYDEAIKLVQALSPLGVRFKVGMQLYYSEGPHIIEAIQNTGGKIFTDLKLHDIPTTVGKAAQSLIKQGVDFFNVHCTGGKAMMQTARQMADEMADTMEKEAPIIIGVTILTSMDETALKEELNVSKTIQNQVVDLAKLAQDSGLNGVVCSAQEASIIKEACGSDFLLVTPGVRLNSSNAQDQHRIMTPQKAIRVGSDYLVVGRPITQASNPIEAAQIVIEEIATSKI